VIFAVIAYVERSRDMELGWLPAHGYEVESFREDRLTRRRDRQDLDTHVADHFALSQKLSADRVVARERRFPGIDVVLGIGSHVAQ